MGILTRKTQATDRKITGCKREISGFFLQVTFAAAVQMHWKPSRTKIGMNKLFCSANVFWSHNFQMARVWGSRWGTFTSLTFLSSSPQSFLPFPSYLFKKVPFLPFQCHSCQLSLLHVSGGSRNYRSCGILAVPLQPPHGCRVHIFFLFPGKAEGLHCPGDECPGELWPRVQETRGILSAGRSSVSCPTGELCLDEVQEVLEELSTCHWGSRMHFPVVRLQQTSRTTLKAQAMVPEQ